MARAFLLFFTVKFKFPALLFFLGEAIWQSGKNMDFNISFATHEICDLEQLSSSLRLSVPSFKMRTQALTCKFGVENKNMTLQVWYITWNRVLQVTNT